MDSKNSSFVKRLRAVKKRTYAPRENVVKTFDSREGRKSTLYKGGRSRCDYHELLQSPNRGEIGERGGGRVGEGVGNFLKSRIEKPIWARLSPA